MKEITTSLVLSHEQNSTQTKVHVLTNHATTTLVANTVLALGAVPSLTDDEDEITHAVESSDALLINLGTPDPRKCRVIEKASNLASLQNKPWVLDPVMIEKFPSRLAFAQKVIHAKPTVIRGNHQEIQALAEKYCPNKPLTKTAHIASYLATSLDTIVISTGSTDFISNGTIVVSCRLGNHLQTLTTGMGCALGGIVATTLTVCKNDPIAAAISGTILAGEAANRAEDVTNGPGSFPADFLDALYQIASKNDPDSFEKTISTSSLQLIALS